MSLSLLTTSDNSITANLLRLKLESEGVPCFLNNEYFTSIMPHYFNMLGSGVRVLVPTNQLENAKEILKINQDRISCPNCESVNIQNAVEKPIYKLKIGLIALFLAAPIGNLLNNYVCQECKHQFKS